MLREKLNYWRGFLHRNDNAISFMDVKALYDQAYSEKAKGRENIKNFRALLRKAVKLDAAYRRQIEDAQIVRGVA